MKKIFFLCTLLFMSIQIQAQMYMVSTVAYNNLTSAGCVSGEIVLLIVSPDGIQTTNCIPVTLTDGLIALNQQLNSIMDEGYQLIESFVAPAGDNGIFSSSGYVRSGITFFLAAP